MALTLLLTSCTAPSNTAPADLLEAMCRSQASLPVGKCYVRSAPQDSDRRLTDELLAVTFGNGFLPPEIDEVSDAAVFFSYVHHTELAVFRCKTTDGTDAIAAMCLRRLDFLRNHRTDQGSEADAYLESACVTVWGRWVIFTVSSDPDAALRAARRAL
jgi:hypothetical protein